VAVPPAPVLNGRLRGHAFALCRVYMLIIIIIIIVVVIIFIITQDYTADKAIGLGEL
jgi:hypothetical protein